MFNKALYATKKIAELMTSAKEIIFLNDKMENVIKKFNDS